MQAGVFAKVRGEMTENSEHPRSLYSTSLEVKVRAMQWPSFSAHCSHPTQYYNVPSGIAVSKIDAVQLTM